nr:butyrophilin subfamily 3 member A2-like isoform X6 [Chelonoidis abingdonii]
MKMRISFHSHCAKGNLSLSSYLIFFFTVHVSTLESVNFKVIGPDHPIIVSAGEDALLPCHLSPSMSAQEMEVRWFQSKFSELVHLYQHGKDQAEKQISKYQGRTELLKDGIVDGRVVLRICNITPSDGGQFICFFRSSSFYGEATLELKVAGLGSAPRISIDSYQSGGIHMVCESAGWYPEPQVQWRDLKGQHLPSLTEKISQHDNGLFEAQISIIVTETSSQDLSCSVRNSQFNQGKESVVYIADPFFLRAYPWKVAVYILLVVVCLVTCTASYFFWKQHEAKAAHVAERGKLVADLGTCHNRLHVRHLVPCSTRGWSFPDPSALQTRHSASPNSSVCLTHVSLQLSDDHHQLPDSASTLSLMSRILVHDSYLSLHITVTITNNFSPPHQH